MLKQGVPAPLFYEVNVNGLAVNALFGRLFFLPSIKCDTSVGLGKEAEPLLFQAEKEGDIYRQ